MFVLSDEQGFAVYRTKGSAFLWLCVVLLACLGFGIGFLSLSGRIHAFGWFGGIFLLVGLWMLFLFPKAVASVTQKPGVLSWSASKDGICISGDGIRISTSGIESADFYPWSAVDKVVLAKKWHQIESDEKHYTWNKVLLFFRSDPYGHDSLIESSRHQRVKTPLGGMVVAAGFPRAEAQTIKMKLERVCPSTVGVIVADKVRFDWQASAVTIE